ncbi:MAG: hypothetical protein NTZ05_10065 [Chloroflexi bacterium]|nr:hypothetical protein [Chloroflexota bacterium]
MSFWGYRIPTLRRAAILLVLVIAAIGLALMVRSGFRLYHRFNGPPPPGPRQTEVSQIQGWMTPPYIARRYRVPPDELFGALGVTPAQHRNSSLNEIAAETGRTSDAVVTEAQQWVAAFRAAHPAPPHPPGAPPGDPAPPAAPSPKAATEREGR